MKRWTVVIEDSGVVRVTDEHGLFPDPGDWDRIKCYGDEVEKQNADVLGAYLSEEEEQTLFDSGWADAGKAFGRA